MPEPIPLKPEELQTRSMTVTHEIALSNYAELFLLVCCCAIAVYAYLRKPQRSTMFFKIGFGLLLIKFLYGMILIAVVNSSPASMESNSDLLDPYDQFLILNYVSYCIGPLGLLFLAMGMYQSIPKAGEQNESEPHQNPGSPKREDANPDSDIDA